MEPEGSLPHSQVPAKCPSPEPTRYSPYPPTSHFLKIRLNIILPSTPGSPKWSLSFRFPHQNHTNASPLMAINVAYFKKKTIYKFIMNVCWFLCCVSLSVLLFALLTAKHVWVLCHSICQVPPPPIFIAYMPRNFNIACQCSSPTLISRHLL